MGGNGSFEKGWGGVPEANRTHEDTGYRIDKHKVLVTESNNEQTKNILNSNSSDAIYIIAKKSKKGEIVAKSINVFYGHNLSYEINLVFDSNGDFIPFSNGKGSHAHIWPKSTSDGILGRQSHSKKNVFPIDSKYDSLIDKIVKFNKQKNK